MTQPGVPPRETLLDLFRMVAEQAGEYIVYDDGYRPRSCSYAEMVRAAGNCAARLEQAGIGQGDNVVLWSENRPEWIAAFWGCVLRGVVVTPIDERHSVNFLERIEQLVHPKAVFTGDEVSLPHSPDRVVWKLSEFDWTTEARYSAVIPKPDDAVQILFTSGATAEPKGVVITHRNLLANTVPVEREIAKYRRYARPFSPIRFLNLLPLSHMFGQAMAIFIPPMLAGTVVFQRSQNPREIIRQIRTRRISVLVSVPKILEVLREYVSGVAPESAVPSPAGTKLWRRWWRYRRAHRIFGMKFWSFIVGGAALDPNLEEFWGGLGFAVIQGYGLTEAAPIVALNHPFHAGKGTVGKPIAGVEIRIAEDGEVLVRGGNVTSGYFNNAEATAEAFKEGWFHTGDIGEMDSSGRLLIKGRKKEMIVLADGRNVFPEDVERALDAQPGVRESAVVGLQDNRGEHVHAVLVLDGPHTAEDVIRGANAELEEHQRVRGFTLWSHPELPRTEGMRKLKRRAILSLIQGESSPASPASGDGMSALLARYASGRAVDSSTTLDDLGLSSLDRVELLVALEQKLGVTVDETVFSQARTVAEMEALIRQPAALAAKAEPFEFESWNRRPWARFIRALNLNLWILPLAHLFAWVRVSGRENLTKLNGPVLIASNHQSYFDTPVLFIAMPWKWRLRIAPTMRKEFFDARFHPEKYGHWKRFTSSLGYYLGCLVFNAVPIAQRESGTRQTLHYLGEMVEEGWCPLIFPEGEHSADDTILPFQAGVAMMASRLRVPVLPVRIRGSNRVLPLHSRFARPGFVDVVIGEPLRLEGEDFAALARTLEQTIRNL